MSSRIVVGYTATKRGRDAVAFAARLAAATGSVLDVGVMIWQSVKRPAFFRGQTLSMDAPASLRKVRR